jgi:hypothetical protein
LVEQCTWTPVAAEQAAAHRREALDLLAAVGLGTSRRQVVDKPAPE